MALPNPSLDTSGGSGWGPCSVPGYAYGGPGCRGSVQDRLDIS